MGSLGWCLLCVNCGASNRCANQRHKISGEKRTICDYFGLAILPKNLEFNLNRILQLKGFNDNIDWLTLVEVIPSHFLDDNANFD